MKLTFDHISKSYGKTKALIDFSAELEPGIYALLGPNGSGKSTLMNILTDNIAADDGKILFDGENVLKMGKRFREKIGFMPQYPGMYANFTAMDFLRYMSTLKGMKAGEAAKEIPKILEAVELSDVAENRISSFSGGMKQRLALAQAVLGDPEILILDEPTAGLDPKQRIAIRNYISEIAFEKTVIIATHIVSDVEYIAKEAIVLKKGVKIASASPSELTKTVAGKVFSVMTSENEVDEFQKAYRVTNIRKSDGQVELRILSEKVPAVSAVPVSPTLEDYYLSVFGENTLL